MSRGRVLRENRPLSFIFKLPDCRGHSLLSFYSFYSYVYYGERRRPTRYGRDLGKYSLLICDYSLLPHSYRARLSAVSCSILGSRTLTLSLSGHGARLVIVFNTSRGLAWAPARPRGGLGTRNQTHLADSDARQSSDQNSSRTVRFTVSRKAWRSPCATKSRSYRPSHRHVQSGWNCRRRRESNAGRRVKNGQSHAGGCVICEDAHWSGWLCRCSCGRCHQQGR